MERYFSKLLLATLIFLLMNCREKTTVPEGIAFQTETIKRVELRGDNWCTTWAADGSQITSMDDRN